MERNAFEVIDQLLKKRLTKQKAAIILNYSVRTIERKIVIFKNKGMKGFIHGNCSTKSNKAVSKIVVNKILRLRNEIYYDFSYIHFWEKLKLEHDVNITYKTLVSILSSNYILSPYSHRSTKRKMAKK